MKHCDLGHLDGPVLVFGGPYSNRQALAAVFAAAEARGIDTDHIICTGDIVAYCGAPVQTVQAIRDKGCAVVAGNCEVQLGADADDCGCGFEEGTTCDLLSVGWYGHAARALSQTDKSWMAGLPDILSFRHQGQRFAVIHGGATDIARFIWSASDDQVFEAEWQAVEVAIGPVDQIIAGHSGIPFIKQTSRGPWINAGVIGIPPHDGRQQTRYAVLDGAECRIHRLDYDVAGAVRDMEAAGLPPDYRQSLKTGYWPSEDVLPPGLRLPSLARG